MYNRDFRKEKTDQGTVTFEHDFNEDMKLRNVFRAARSSQNYVWTQPDDSKGNVQNGMVWRRGNARVSDTATYQNVTDLTGKFDTGALKHSYNVGLELAYEKANAQSAAIQKGSTSCKTGVGAAGDYICTDLNNPTPNDPWLFDVTLPDATKYHTKTTSVYAFDTIEFNPQWMMNAGVRFTAMSLAHKPQMQSVSNALTICGITNWAWCTNHCLTAAFTPTSPLLLPQAIHSWAKAWKTKAFLTAQLAAIQ